MRRPSPYLTWRLKDGVEYRSVLDHIVKIEAATAVTATATPPPVTAAGHGACGLLLLLLPRLLLASSLLGFALLLQLGEMNSPSL